MVRDFPLPREQLADFSATHQEHLVCKDFATRLLTHTVQEYEHFAYDKRGVVDPKAWKTQAWRGELTMYREREAGGVGDSLADSLHRCAAKSPLFSPTAAALTPATMMLTGVHHGYVENAVSTLVTRSQEELALVVKYLHGEVADCGVLHTMEAPTDENPFHFLGFKFYVSRAVGDPRLCKRRHCVYLESSGLTRTRTGEELGYHIMHSVALPQFPDLTGRNSIYALMSTRFLYRQKRDGLVEIFMLGNMAIQGMAIKPISQLYAVESMLDMTRLLDCSETKRLTQMAREYQWRKHMERRRGVSPQEAMRSPPSMFTLCSVCQRVGKGGGFGAVKLVECLVCGRVACPRCRASKQVFVSANDGLLGKLIKVPVCSGCILEANTSFYEFRRAQQKFGVGGERTPQPETEQRRDFTNRTMNEGRSGSTRDIERALPSPSPSPRRRMTAYWSGDKSPLTPNTQVSTPESYTPTRQTWVATPRTAANIRLTPEDGVFSIEERSPLRRPRSTPPPVPMPGPTPLNRNISA
ncbi:hypothetical protein BBJ28_00001642 [Nothophytophthora sp. Chile5]|nr:hypothetical protein BBJ28_00001642 [Nothophytophthora sp. Chile5]